MAVASSAVREPEERLFGDMWPLYAGGLAAGALAYALSGVLMGGWWPARLTLIGIAVAAAGIAVALRPKSTIVLVAAAVAALLCASAIAQPINDHTEGNATPTGEASGLQMRGHTIELPQGYPYEGPVATLGVLPNQKSPTENITILWGDGTSTPGYTRMLSSGYLAIQSRKTYEDEGVYPVQITMRADDGQTASARTIARVTRWDGSRMLLWVLAAVAALAAVLVLVPVIVRRVVISLLILFHFGGIFSAVTNISNYAPAPWWSQKIWLEVYRPYLMFMYLNNAYHYYSPDPGPASFIWMRIEYEPRNGMRYWRWVKLPELDDNGTPINPDGGSIGPYVEYTRRLSLAESVSGNAPGPNFYNQILPVRLQAGKRHQIDLDPNWGPELQYRPLAPEATLWLQSYVRHAARTYHHAEHPELPVVGVKVYLVVHSILLPDEFIADGANAYDPEHYRPFYEGEYDKDGNLKSLNDPFYGWLIPIVRKLKSGAKEPPGEHRHSKDETEVINYLKIHAGDVAPPKSPDKDEPS
jgi:hypothetical protein